MKKERFNCFLSDISFEKSGENNGKVTNYKFKAVASTPDEDTDGEIIEPMGVDTKSFVDTSFINYNHLLKSNPLSLIGEPTNAYVKDNQLVIEGILYGNSPLARDVVTAAEILEKSGSKKRIGVSIEGIPISRNPLNKKHITKARLTGAALTFSPKNHSTWMQIVKGEQSDDFVNYEYEPIEKSDANGSMSPEYLVDITDKDKGIRVRMDRNLTIKIEKSMTTDSPSGKAMKKESLEKKPKNLFEFQKAVVTISKGHELGMVPDDMIEKARMHKYLRKEGDKYIYKESEEREKKMDFNKIANEFDQWVKDKNIKKNRSALMIFLDEKYTNYNDNVNKEIVEKILGKNKEDKSPEKKEVDYSKYTVHAVSNEDVGVEMKKWRNMGYTEVKRGDSSNGKTQILISKVKKKEINPNK